MHPASIHSFRCVGCRTRVKVVDAEPLCAGCGRPLERVVSAADLLGYRLVEPEAELAGRIRAALAGDDDPPGPPPRVT